MEFFSKDRYKVLWKITLGSIPLAIAAKKRTASGMENRKPSLFFRFVG
jgi:hypothetical protein